MVNHRKMYFLLLLLLACISVAAFFFPRIGTLLSKSAQPHPADIIVCISGNVTRVQKCVDLLGKGYASKIAVTTEAAYRSFLRYNISPDMLLKADWSADSTYEEGLLLNSMLGDSYETALVITDSFHLYRVKWTLNNCLSQGGVDFTFLSTDKDWRSESWWQQKESQIYVLSELPKIIYYWIWHGILGIEKDPFWAKGLETWYLKCVHQLL